MTAFEDVVQSTEKTLFRVECLARFHHEALAQRIANVPIRQWVQDFCERAARCPLDELERKTSPKFAQDMLGMVWQFFLESRAAETIQAPIKDAVRERVQWLHKVQDLLHERADDPISQKMSEALAETVSPALKAEMRKRPRGKPRPASDNISSPSRTAWTLIEQARAETGKPHWDLFAKILQILFPNDFLDNSAENLRRRVVEFQQRHNLSMKKDRK